MDCLWGMTALSSWFPSEPVVLCSTEKTSDPPKSGRLDCIEETHIPLSHCYEEAQSAQRVVLSGWKTRIWPKPYFVRNCIGNWDLEVIIILSFPSQLLMPILSRQRIPCLGERTSKIHQHWLVSSIWFPGWISSSQILAMLQNHWKN